MSAEGPTRADIEAAAERIAGRIRTTPVVTIEGAALGLTHDVDFKLEHLQVTGAFKVRGALNNLLGRDVAGHEIVAISGGNHGAAVAHAATGLGLTSVVYVPKTIAKPEKCERMERLGAEVRLIDGTTSDAFKLYEAHAAQAGALAVHPYDGTWTLAGQGTLGPEIERQVPGLDTLFVSVGGGGLIGGIQAWFAGTGTQVVAVETEGTALLHRALVEGPDVAIAPKGISASSLGASTIGADCYRICKAAGTPTLVVSDEDTTEAQRRLWDAARQVVEPGAATALAALTSGAYSPRPRERVGVLLCGGNAAPDWFVG